MAVGTVTGLLWFLNVVAGVLSRSLVSELTNFLSMVSKALCIDTTAELIGPSWLAGKEGLAGVVDWAVLGVMGLLVVVVVLEVWMAPLCVVWRVWVF